ncbi:hypothetical protein WG66_000733 [Moniliophthora roreri]|nr:hypothetical protein WG66_000733 [Moniliophthora roreri]
MPPEFLVKHGRVPPTSTIETKLIWLARLHAKEITLKWARLQFGNTEDTKTSNPGFSYMTSLNMDAKWQKVRSTF